ncbi:MAG: hypothetical protein IJ706_02625 [Clostridia bacterium]|nr:hypothetical protein [Clostridia bacterium]
MARTFPAVLIHGILESGKTRFIIDSVKNGDFGDIGRVLILSMEEGEEEYDAKELAKYNAVAYTFDSQEEFTVEKINELVKINKPHAIFFEMNEMWDMEKLKFPPYILVEQAFTIIDASTFKIYFNNMRQKFTDMVKESDVVIMNRCEETPEMAGFKRSIKIINKNAQFITLGKNGETVSFVEDLPYKLQDEMPISDENFGIFYIDTFDNPSRYDGKIVEFDCIGVIADELPPNTFVAGRPAMTCCANDIQFIGHLCSFTAAQNFKDKSWIKLRSRVHYVRMDGETDPQCVLEALSMTPIPEPAEPVVNLT